MSQSEPHVLVVNTGGSDVKLWYLPEDASAPPASVEIEGAEHQVRKFHQHLRDNPQSWRMVATVECLAKTLQTGLPDGKPVSISRQYRANDEGRPQALAKSAYTPALDSDGRWLLHPAKIATLINGLAEAGKGAQPIRIKRVLLVYSERPRPASLDDESSKRAHRRLTSAERDFLKEPIATGDLLGRWIARRLGLTFAGELPDGDLDDAVYCFNFLRTRERYEGKAAENVPLHTKVARDLDQAISRIAHGLGQATAVFSNTGGAGPVKDLAMASLKLRFNRRVRVWAATKNSEFSFEDLQSLQSAPVSRAESLDARARALARLWVGDFVGAWAAVSHLRGSDQDERWLACLRRLRAAFVGSDPGLGGGTSVLAKLTGDRPEQLRRTAFRIEAALQANATEDRNFIEALVPTRTFLDLLQEVAILHYLRQHAAFERVDSTSHRVHFRDGVLPDEFAIPEKEGESKKEKARRQFYAYFEKKGSGWRINARAESQWRKWLADRCCESVTRFFERYDNSTGNHRKSVKDFRNAQVHGALMRNDLEALADEATEHHAAYGPLWQLVDHKHDVQRLGRCFLSVPCVTAAFDELQLGDPVADYRALFQELLDELHAPVDVVSD